MDGGVTPGPGLGGDRGVGGHTGAGLGGDRGGGGVKPVTPVTGHVTGATGGGGADGEKW